MRSRVGSRSMKPRSQDDLTMLCRGLRRRQRHRVIVGRSRSEADARHSPTPFARTIDVSHASGLQPHHSETEMLRYIRGSNRSDLRSTTSMIPLGSCTMKLNATAEMYPGDVAGVRKHSSVRAARADARAISELFEQLEAVARGDHRLRRACRCSRTPARRANTRACSSSARITNRAAKRIATSA